MIEMATRAFELRCRPPLVTAAGSIDHRRGYAIRLASDGHIGIGEATPLPGWGETFAACGEAVRACAGGTPPTTVAEIRLPEDRPAARHGVQLAALDLAARRQEMPLAKYLGGAQYDDRIPVNATIDRRDETPASSRAVRAVENGYHTIKCKVGPGDLDAELDRIASVYDSIGDDIDLRLDANRSWTPSEAIEVFERLEGMGISYVEEPLKRPTPAALEALVPFDTAVAIDETVAATSISECSRWFEVVDVVVLKPMALGGIDRAIEVAHAARDHGIVTVVSNTVDAVIARTAAVHLAAALPGSAAAGLATGSWLETDLAADPAPVRNGTIRVPDSPGIGTCGPWERVRSREEQEGDVSD